MGTATQSFIDTLTQTPQLATALQQNVERLKDDLGQIITVLGYTKTVADDLDKLDGALKTASDLLTYVSVIPDVGEAAAALKEWIAAVSEVVTPARKAADQLEKEVKPLRETLEKLDPILGQFIKLTQEIESTSQKFLGEFTAVVNCVDSLPDGDYKQQAQTYLDQFSKDAEPIVSSLNTALNVANQSIDAFYQELNRLASALDPLKAIADEVEQILSYLDPIIDALNSVANALKSLSITINLGYPVTISLYDVFTEFSYLIDQAMGMIQSFVDDLLKALQIPLPSIPDLSYLLDLNITIPDVPDFTALLAAIQDAYNQFLAAIARFNLTCPPDPGTPPPIWAGL